MTLLRVLKERLSRGIVTGQWPDDAPALFRGMPRLDPARCRGHGQCATACPSQAIAVELGGDGGWSWQLDRARCVGCGACVDACPTSALSASLDYELAALRREDLLVAVDFRPTESEP